MESCTGYLAASATSCKFSSDMGTNVQTAEKALDPLASDSARCCRVMCKKWGIACLDKLKRPPAYLRGYMLPSLVLHL